MYNTNKVGLNIFLSTTSIYCLHNAIFFIYFHLYIYPPDSQESNRGANT